MCSSDLVRIKNDLNIYQNNLSKAGHLYFEEGPSGTAKGPFMYHLGKVDVTGDMRFDNLDQNKRNFRKISTINASKLVDNDDERYSIDPSTAATIHSLIITNTLDVLGDLTVAGGATITNHVFARDSLESATTIKVITLSDLDNPDYFVDPPRISKLKGLEVVDSLKIDGNFNVNSELIVNGQLIVNGSLESSGALNIEQPQQYSLIGPKILEPSIGIRRLDPSLKSTLKDLSIVDDLQVGGFLKLSDSLTHRGSALIVGDIDASGSLQTQKLIDFHNNNYYADPNSSSRLHSLTVENSLKVSQSTSFSDSLTVVGFISSDSSFELSESLEIGKTLTGYESLQIDYLSTQTLEFETGFSVDEKGDVIARSITLENQAFAQDLTIGGDLDLSGSPIEFNANTSMKTFTISTHSLISWSPSSFATVARIDQSGNIFTSKDMDIGRILQVGASRFSYLTDSKEVLLSLTNSSIQTIYIGERMGEYGSKKIILSGVEADTLSAPIAYLEKFEDRDDANIFSIQAHCRKSTNFLLSIN